MKKVVLSSVAALAIFAAAAPVFAQGRADNAPIIAEKDGKKVNINDKKARDEYVKVNGEQIVTPAEPGQGTGVVVDPSEQGKDVKWETIDKYEDARLAKESLEKTAAANKAEDKKAEEKAAAPAAAKVLPKTSAVK